MTVIEVLKLASDHLARHSSDSSRLDAEVLLANALGLSRIDLYLKFDRPLSEAELTTYRGMVARRAKGEPVAYLVGHKEFMALEFEVTPAVLVPNPDTEVLVQRAVAIARSAGRPLRVADVGTGSGNIAIAIAHYARDVEVWAGDVSAGALEVAARNAARHGVESRVHLACGDLMDPLPGTFDLVCANLPYVPEGKVLAPEVVAQPARSLYADQDGAGLVLRLLAEVDPLILAAVLYEADRSYAGRAVHRDLGGHERALEAWSSIPANSEPSA